MTGIKWFEHYAAAIIGYTESSVQQEKLYMNIVVLASGGNNEAVNALFPDLIVLILVFHSKFLNNTLLRYKGIRWVE